MTKDEIIAMARDAGFVLADNATDEAIGRFASFASMATEKAAASEREACAQVCDTVYYKNLGPINGEVRHGIAQCASAIRARGTSDGLTT